MSDQETASITVMRTCDAKKAEFEMQMAASLNDLKDSINQSEAFGPLPRENQRIFHLGRELKTGGRSLSTLGIGRFRVFTVHLLAKAPTSQGNGQQPQGDDGEVVEVVQKRRARNRVQNARAMQQQQSGEVIELSDDDDDVVEIVEVPPKRQRTQER